MQRAYIDFRSENDVAISIISIVSSAAEPRFISLSDQEPLTAEERVRALHAAAQVKGFWEHREKRIAELGLDPGIWMPAANWNLEQPFYREAYRIMRGEDLEWLRQRMQFTGFGLWCMKRPPDLPPGAIEDIQRNLIEIGKTPDEVALGWCERVRAELPEYLRISPPRKFGEAGWLVDDVIYNQDTAVFWERLAILYRAGFLNRESARALKRGARILEIGAGQGCLAYYIQRAVPGVDYTIVDIPESLVYSAVYLSVLNPEAKKVFLPNYEFPALVKDAPCFDLVINTLSMTEMTEVQVRTYCEGIKTLIGSSGVFFEQNQDGRSVGLLFAREIVRDYFAHEDLLGGPGLNPWLTQGFATLWSN